MVIILGTAEKAAPNKKGAEAPFFQEMSGALIDPATAV
jgi:hypothetical protein